MATLKLKDFEYYLDDIAKRQLPFACAKALTNTSAALGNSLAKQASHRFKTLTPFSRTHKTAKIGASPSPASSFSTLPANKAHGLDRMQATLGNQHWGITEQIEETSTIRKPKSSRYLWVPVQGKKRNFTPKKALAKKGVFITNTKKGTMIMQRSGKSRKITPLFLRRKQQNIKPVFNMKRLVESRAQRYMDIFFERAMEQALRTAR